MISALANTVFKNKPYQKWRENQCCVCGNTKGLAKHHLVPSCYIGKIFKSNPVIRQAVLYEYDFCCMCHDCHQKFNKNFQDLLHQLIWEKYSIDVKQTSHRQPKSNLPKPSTLVSNQINTAEDYLALRKFCTDKFLEWMQPKYPLLGFIDEINYESF